MVFQLGAGLLESCVLAVLQQGDAYGYALTQKVQSAFSISESSLYPVLRRLQKEGSLTVYDQPFDGRNRRYYSLTPNGHARLEDCVAEWELYKQKVDLILLRRLEQ